MWLRQTQGHAQNLEKGSNGSLPHGRGSDLQSEAVTRILMIEAI